MQPVDFGALEPLLKAAGVEMSSPEQGIGRHLAYRSAPKRVFVIHLADDAADEDAHAALRCILPASDEWILIERHTGNPASNWVAERFTGPEREALLNRLGSVKLIRPGGTGDLYLLSEDGEALVTWDHHTNAKGLVVQFSDVGRSEAVLLGLNRVGTEMDIFYAT